MARFKKAKERKHPWLGKLEEAYHYANPNRNDFFDKTKGSKKNIDVYDSTAVVGLQRFATRLQTTMVPSWRRWATMVAGDEIPENEKEEVNMALSGITDVFFKHLNFSNFSLKSHEAFQDLCISTGALLFHEGDSENIFNFSSVPLSSLYLEEAANGEVETVWREISVAPRNLSSTWKDVRPTQELKDCMNNSPDKELEFLEGTVFDPEKRDYRYVVLYKKNLIVERKYEISPWVVFRWGTNPGEVYGTGPVLNVLPDILTLNKVKEYTLLNGAMAIAGMFTARNDGVLNPYTVEIGPNMVIPVGSNDRSNPSLAPIPQSGNFDVSQLIIKDLQETIKKAMFVDQLGPVEGAVKSATEISIRNQELLQDIGGNFGRLQTEFISKVVSRGVAILQSRGKIPRFKVDGNEVTLRHESPLAKGQDQEDVIAFQQMIETVGAIAPEMLAMGVKMEDVPQWLSEKLGVDQMIMRSKGEREQMQQAAQQAAAMQAPQGEVAVP